MKKTKKHDARLYFASCVRHLGALIPRAIMYTPVLLAAS